LHPIGSLQSITPDGGVAVAKAAEEFGTVNFVSSVTQPSLEEIAAASRNAKIFQLYVQGDLKWVENLLLRVKRAGYSALCLTVDTAHYGRRERQRMDRWLPPSRRGVGYEYRASLTLGEHGGDQRVGRLAIRFKGSRHGRGCNAGCGAWRQRDLCLQSRWAAARSRARDYTHAVGNSRGGRRTSTDRIRRRCVVCGSDALKAVALGARAVAIGKMQGWGLAAGGHAGLVRVLEILESEIVTTMALLGITRLDQLTPAHLCEAQQLGPSHEMSAFTHIPGGQLCKFFPNRGCICRRSTRLLSEGGPAEWLRALPAWTCTILSTSAQ
jgi:hypothetical protein